MVKLGVFVFGLLLLVFGFVDAYMPGDVSSFESSSESTVTYRYDRIDEVKKQCGPVLLSAVELRPDNKRIFLLKDDLSFVNGDWTQDLGKSPLMPYVVREVLKGKGNFTSFRSPLRLASFFVNDVDIDHRSKKSVGVNGVMVIGTTLDSVGEKPYENSPQFQIWPGHTQIVISFEGIYTESKKNGGERVMCLLGSTVLPSRESDSGDSWDWVKGSGYNNPPLLEDDQILLVLNYPMSFTLTNRNVRGDLRSLNQKLNPKYFNDVHILSQLAKSANYEFSSGKLVSKVCDPYPSNDTLFSGGVDIYKGNRFCEILQQIAGAGVAPFTVVANWRCNGTDDFCSKLGPFFSDKAIKATDGSFKGVGLLMQDVKCQQTTVKGNAVSANVAGVFRAVPLMENDYSAALRSGPSNMTMAAEGIWRSSNGQLCMVGCLGLVDADGSSCNSRICLYIPISFSIKQRSIAFGSISSIDKASTSYFPLSFEKILRPNELWDYFKTTSPYYTYSKLEEAGTILERNEPFSFNTIVKKSLLQFPKLEEAEAKVTSLSILAEDLTIHTSAFPDPLPSSKSRPTDLQLEVLSVGPLFGRYWSPNISVEEEEAPYHSKAEYTEKQLLMNVSAQIMLSGEAFSNFSLLFLEGLYDPHVGMMYLAGCRDVRASWNILFESMDLEAGLDCFIEATVSYPPTTARWMVNPNARISISSRRNDDDPLHFSPIKLQTLPVTYRKQREDILSRRGIEGILRILTLSFAIACVSSQLFYINHNLDSVPFMSLVMLGVQALGYSLPLITGAEAIFKRKSSDSYGISSDNIEESRWIHLIDYTVKILVLVVFLLTLRLCQKVWKSRIRLLSRSPREPHRVPSDKWVFLATLIIHATGYVLVLITHSLTSNKKRHAYEQDIDAIGFSHAQAEWETELEEYVGLVQDFFLLPQIISNVLWQLDSQPLRKLYFIGITIVRLLPHLYDYVTAPVLNPYLGEVSEFVNPKMDFYSRFGDIFIPTTAVLLAGIVYVQQRWDYKKLSQVLTLGRFRLLPSRSVAYQRLSSKPSEAELATSTKANDHKLDEELDDEE